jgi:hypothetical protein
LLIQEMHFLCHHLTTRGNFLSLSLSLSLSLCWYISIHGFDFEVMNWLHFVSAVGIGT